MVTERLAVSALKSTSPLYDAVRLCVPTQAAKNKHRLTGRHVRGAKDGVTLEYVTVPVALPEPTVSAVVRESGWPKEAGLGLLLKANDPVAFVTATVRLAVLLVYDPSPL